MEEEHDCCPLEAQLALGQARQEAWSLLGSVATVLARNSRSSASKRSSVSHGNAASDQGGMHSKAPVAYALLATLPIGQPNKQGPAKALLPECRVGATGRRATTRCAGRRCRSRSRAPARCRRCRSTSRPTPTGEGRDGIAKMIEAARGEFPGHAFTLRGAPDGRGSYVEVGLLPNS